MGDEGWFYSGLPQNRLLEANAHPGVYVAAVIQATWSQVEPQQGVFDDTALDAGLQNVAAYNTKYPATPLAVKLRVFAGTATPAWVLQQVGSVQLYNRHTSGNSTMPDFWTTAYSQLWTQLQAHLASVYDSDPLVAEVGVTSCSSFTGEPFVDGAPDGANAQTLVAAGYTDAQMEACISNAWNDYAAWTKTPLDLPSGPLYLAQARQLDTAFPVQVMQSFRQTLGVRAVEGNQGLDDPISAGLEPIYAELQALYGDAAASNPPTVSPLEFQTAGPTVDWPAVIPFAISTYHPTEIEVWNTTASGAGVAPVTQSELQQWAMQMKSSNP